MLNTLREYQPQRVHTDITLYDFYMIVWVTVHLEGTENN